LRMSQYALLPQHVVVFRYSAPHVVASRVNQVDYFCLREDLAYPAEARYSPPTARRLAAQ
jgi:hypothetical protein